MRRMSRSMSWRRNEKCTFKRDVCIGIGNKVNFAVAHVVA